MQFVECERIIEDRFRKLSICQLKYSQIQDLNLMTEDKFSNGLTCVNGKP